MDTQLLFFLTDDASDGGFDIPTTLFLPLVEALVELRHILTRALVALTLLFAVEALELAAELRVY